MCGGGVSTKYVRSFDFAFLICKALRGYGHVKTMTGIMSYRGMEILMRRQPVSNNANAQNPVLVGGKAYGMGKVDLHSQLMDSLIRPDLLTAAAAAHSISLQRGKATSNSPLLPIDRLSRGAPTRRRRRARCRRLVRRLSIRWILIRRRRRLALGEWRKSFLNCRWF